MDLKKTNRASLLAQHRSDAQYAGFGERWNALMKLSLATWCSTRDDRSIGRRTRSMSISVRPISDDRSSGSMSCKGAPRQSCPAESRHAGSFGAGQKFVLRCSGVVEQSESVVFFCLLIRLSFWINFILHFYLESQTLSAKCQPPRLCATRAGKVRDPLTTAPRRLGAPC